jgi:hypothetical protein
VSVVVNGSVVEMVNEVLIFDLLCPEHPYSDEPFGITCEEEPLRVTKSCAVHLPIVCVIALCKNSRLSSEKYHTQME